MFEKRIIIGGVPRAGTTLFRYVLDASDAIIAGPETGFFLRPLALQQARADRVARRIDRVLEVGEGELERMINDATDSISAFDAMMDAYAKRAGVTKTAWAEKTPWNCSSYDWLVREDPDLYFISLVRDGRDVVTSVRDDAYYISIQAYVETMKFILAFAHPRHLVVRYESMVEQPEACFRAVLSFLDLPFDVKALEAYRDASVTRDATKVRQPKVTKEISTEWIERWRSPEHAERIREFDAHPRALDVLAAAGYGERNRVES